MTLLSQTVVVWESLFNQDKNSLVKEEIMVILLKTHKYTHTQHTQNPSNSLNISRMVLVVTDDTESGQSNSL